MEIVLIRHTSVDVPQGTCYGQTDVPVKTTFEQEAAETKKNLEPLGPFDKVYCSPLTRCVKLATYCGYPDAERDNRIKELNFGAWEMQKFDEIKDPRMQEWFDDYLNVPVTDGESFMQLYQRVAAFLDEVRQKPYERVAVFAHGGVLLCAQAYAGLVKFEEAFSALTPYGGVITIKIEN